MIEQIIGIGLKSNNDVYIIKPNFPIKFIAKVSFDHLISFDISIL